MSRAKGRQLLQQRPHRERADRADRQHLLDSARLELFENRVDPAEGLPQGRRQRQPLVGQHQAPVRTAEQGGAEALLQSLDLMADRRLGHAQLLGGAGEGQVAGRRLEGAQGVERRGQTRHRLVFLIPLPSALRLRLVILRLFFCIARTGGKVHEGI